MPPTGVPVGRTGIRSSHSPLYGPLRRLPARRATGVPRLAALRLVGARLKLPYHISDDIGRRDRARLATYFLGWVDYWVLLGECPRLGRPKVQFRWGH
jgi:hypothetical protein